MFTINPPVSRSNTLSMISALQFCQEEDLPHNKHVVRNSGSLKIREILCVLIAFSHGRAIYLCPQRQREGSRRYGYRNSLIFYYLTLSRKEYFTTKLGIPAM